MNPQMTQMNTDKRIEINCLGNSNLRESAQSVDKGSRK